MIKEIIVKGIRISYDVTGPEDAPPLLLMHGWGCNHSTVRSVAAIAEQHHRVYNVDLPGHGNSEEPPEPWNTSMMAEAVEELCKKLSIKQPVLIGHSFGGRLSLMMASRNDIPKMVLIDAAGIKAKRGFKKNVKIYTFKTIKNILLTFLGKEKGNKLVDRIRPIFGSADYKNSSSMMRNVMSRCTSEDLKYLMPDIKASTLLIWGTDDTATPLSDAETMEKLIPDAGLVKFDGCGHYSFLDNPFGFSLALKNFLR